MATGQIVVQQKNQRQFVCRAKGPVRNRLSPSSVLYHRTFSPSTSVSSLVILRSRWMGICLQQRKLFASFPFSPAEMAALPKTPDHILYHRQARNRRRQVVQTRSKSRTYRAKMPGKPYRSTAGRLRAPLGCRGRPTTRRQFESRHSEKGEGLEIEEISRPSLFYPVPHSGEKRVPPFSAGHLAFVSQSRSLRAPVLPLDNPLPVWYNAFRPVICSQL